MDPLTIFQAIQKSTSSGRGVSYWAEAANCGERRYLLDITPLQSMANDAMRRGTLFHALMHFRATRQISRDTLLDVGPIQDPLWRDAVKLYNFMEEFFPEGYFGQTIHSEVAFAHPTEPELTGQLDRVVHLEEEHCLQFFQDFGVGLPGPGYYILDWKTATARVNEYRARGSYLESIQSKMYPTLARLNGLPVRGMLFFVVVNHAEMRRYDEGPKRSASVQAFYVDHTEERAEQAMAAYRFAKAMRDGRVKNPYACINYEGIECPFRAGGVCRGV